MSALEHQEKQLLELNSTHSGSKTHLQKDVTKPSIGRTKAPLNPYPHISLLTMKLLHEPPTSNKHHSCSKLKQFNSFGHMTQKGNYREKCTIQTWMADDLANLSSQRCNHFVGHKMTCFVFEVRKGNGTNWKVEHGSQRINYFSFQLLNSINYKTICFWHY